LHALLLAGDTSIRDEQARLLLPDIRNVLAARYRQIDPSLIADAAEDAVLKYLRNPSAFNPSRGSLKAFVTRIALTRLIDVLRADGRLRLVQLTAQLEATLADHRAPPFLLEPDADTAGTGGWNIDDLRLDAREQRFLEARLAGERRTTALASILGFSDESAAIQRTAVKRMRATLLDRLRRLAARRR
jgi:DNA-directed RNA polymerase specialized sigma24 family protein